MFSQIWTRLIINRKTQKKPPYFILWCAIGLTLNHKLLLKSLHQLLHLRGNFFLKQEKVQCSGCLGGGERCLVGFVFWGFFSLFGKQPVLLLPMTKNKQTRQGWQARGEDSPSGKAIKICHIRNHLNKNANKHKPLPQHWRPDQPPAGWAQGHWVSWAAETLSFTKSLLHYNSRNVRQPIHEVMGHGGIWVNHSQNSPTTKKSLYKAAKRAGIYHCTSCHPSAGDRQASARGPAGV